MDYIKTDEGYKDVDENIFTNIFVSRAARTFSLSKLETIEKLFQSLKGCKKCIDCVNCDYCTECIDCIDCIGLHGRVGVEFNID